MKPVLSFLFFLLCCFSSYAQTRFRIDFHAGYGINSDISLFNEEVKKANAFVIQSGVVVNFNPLFLHDFSWETGIYGKYCHNNASIGVNRFLYQTLRVFVPLLTNYKINEKWNLQAGVHFQNNRDFDDVFVGQPFNFRFDGIFGAGYALNKRLDFSFKYNHVLSKLGPAYFINDPSYSVLLGARFLLNHSVCK